MGTGDLAEYHSTFTGTCRTLWNTLDMCQQIPKPGSLPKLKYAPEWYPRLGCRGWQWALSSGSIFSDRRLYIDLVILMTYCLPCCSSALCLDFDRGFYSITSSYSILLKDLNQSSRRKVVIEVMMVVKHWRPVIQVRWYRDSPVLSPIFLAILGGTCLFCMLCLALIRVTYQFANNVKLIYISLSLFLFSWVRQLQNVGVSA